MIVKIVNRFGIELETTLKIAEAMIKKGEITTYETLEWDVVEGQSDPVEALVIKLKNITRKPKI